MTEEHLEGYGAQEASTLVFLPPQTSTKEGSGTQFIMLSIHFVSHFPLSLFSFYFLFFCDLSFFRFSQLLFHRFHIILFFPLLALSPFSSILVLSCFPFSLFFTTSPSHQPFYLLFFLLSFPISSYFPPSFMILRVFSSCISHPFSAHFLYFLFFSLFLFVSALRLFPFSFLPSLLSPGKSHRILHLLRLISTLLSVTL